VVILGRSFEIFSFVIKHSIKMQTIIANNVGTYLGRIRQVRPIQKTLEIVFVVFNRFWRTI